MYVLFCIFCFHRANWYSATTLPEVFHAFSSVVRQMPGYNSQRRGTARTLPKIFVLFYVLFVCKCVLYYCHRVSTQLQLTRISISYFITDMNCANLRQLARRRNRIEANSFVRSETRVARNRIEANSFVRSETRVARNRTEANSFVRSETRVARNRIEAYSFVRSETRVARNWIEANSFVRNETKVARK